MARWRLAAFDAAVPHATRSAFVLFYAPWCGHCKALKPTWSQFAAQHKDSKELLVAEVDCTDSKGGEAICERYDVEGFPTIKYFDAGESEPEDFEDERGIEALEAFAKEMANSCKPSQLELCSAEEKAIIASHRALSETMYLVERRDETRRVPGACRPPPLRPLIFQADAGIRHGFTCLECRSVLLRSRRMG